MLGGKLRTQCFFMHTAKTLIRLGRCTAKILIRSESSLVLSCCGLGKTQEEFFSTIIHLSVFSWIPPQCKWKVLTLIHTCRPQVNFLTFIIIKSDSLKKGIMTESSKFRQYYRPNKKFVSFPETLPTLLSWGLVYSIIFLGAYLSSYVSPL